MKMFINNNGTNKEFTYSPKKKYNIILLSFLIKSSTLFGNKM